MRSGRRGPGTAFNGGRGSDTVVAPNAVTTFDFTGANLGHLGLLSFSSVENLKGNVRSDTFRFGPTGALARWPGLWVA